MPTPESESFLRKKPTVPPTFDGVDMGNGEAVANARDAIIREQWVQVMMARLVREEMGKCYHREGVNHLEKCGKYRGRPDSASTVRVMRCEGPRLTAVIRPIPAITENCKGTRL